MERIGEYLVRRMVGEGGMGKVYEAEERLSKRRVALKVLRPELRHSEQGRQMFLNEMTILAHLDHPNIVRSLACSELDGELVMVLELLEGETLRERLAKRGKLDWQEAVAIAADVAAALTAAHGQEPPIVHRDLKPENLMVLAGGATRRPPNRDSGPPRADAPSSGSPTEAGAERVQVKVMDFGIGKVMQALRKSTTQSVGTLQYMSPEQIDAGNVDHRSDLYSLGLVMYEMLAGAPPFQSESPRELLNLQCTAAPPPLPDDVRAQLPRGIERTLLRLLEKAAADRPASAAEVVAALEPFVSATGVTPAARTPATASGSLPAVAPVTPTAPRVDTIALLERAGRPREVSTRRAVPIIVACCAATAVVTYVARVGWPW